MDGQVAGAQSELGVVLNIGQVADVLPALLNLSGILGQDDQNVAAQSQGGLREVRHLDSADFELGLAFPTGDTVGGSSDEGQVAAEELVLSVVVLGGQHVAVLDQAVPVVSNFHSLSIVEDGLCSAILHLNDLTAVLHQHGLEQPSFVGGVESSELSVAGDVAALHALLQDILELSPGLGRIGHVDAGSSQNVLVVVHNLSGDAVGDSAVGAAVEDAVVHHAGEHIVDVEATLVDQVSHTEVALTAGVQRAGVSQSNVGLVAGQQSSGDLGATVGGAAGVGQVQGNLVVAFVESGGLSGEHLAAGTGNGVPNIQGHGLIGGSGSFFVALVLSGLVGGDGSLGLVGVLGILRNTAGQSAAEHQNAQQQSNNLLSHF